MSLGSMAVEGLWMSECLPRAVQFFVTFLSWSSGMALLLKASHVCPCDVNWCCHHAPTAGCLTNQCYCTPTAPLEGLLLMGHCENERHEMDGPTSMLVAILLIFPFLLHIFQMIMNCSYAENVPTAMNSLPNEHLLLV